MTNYKCRYMPTNKVTIPTHKCEGYLCELAVEGLCPLGYTVDD